MPSKIHILPELMMKRIAAGEVVERPASVVKELIENSIDAGSGTITLSIKGSGMDQIQVIDDGEGMTEEDALICFERHATSKVSHPEDLEAIRTMGFRGEALASICSVSRMTVTTSTGSEEGTQVITEGGSIREVLKTAAQKGTTVTVKDLFASVPARRKFLKSPTTELRHIIAVFRRIALSHPEIDFALYIEDEKTMDLRKGTAEARIKDLLSEKKVSGLINVEKETPGISIHGYISRPGERPGSRGDQFFFLNRRYIVSRSLVHGVLSAYGPRLSKDEHPVYVIFLEMDPGQVDVNVHPTKIEVRFLDEKFVHDSLHRAVQEALRKPVASPEFHLMAGRRKAKSFSRHRPASIEEYGQLTLEAQRPEVNDKLIAYHRISEKESPSVWQIHNRYILSQIKSGLTIIDQHVAHERILYERAMEAKKGSVGLSQQILFPQTVELTPDDFLILTEILPYLERIGFGLKEFGKNTVVIEAVPVEVKTGSERELLQEIIEEYKEGRGETVDTLDAVAKAFACKSAIKSGEHLTLQEMAFLIDQLFATKEPYFCPHGRPIVVNLSLEDIDKRFGR